MPEEVRLEIGLRHAHEYDPPLYLAYGRIDRMDHEADFDTRSAPEDAFGHYVDVSVADGEPHFDLGTVAYQLLVRLYDWFDFTDEAVPYTNDERTAIEIAQILVP